MMLELITGVMIGAAVGFLIRMTFRLLQRQQEESAFDMLRYASVSELVALQPRIRRPLRYVAFRFLPVAAGYVLAIGVAQAMTDGTIASSIAAVATSLFISAWPSTRALMSPRPGREALIHVTTIVGMLILGITLAMASLAVDFSPLAPDPTALRDGILGTVISALLLIWYFDLTNMRRGEENHSSGLTRKEARQVLKRHQRLRRWSDIQAAVRACSERSGLTHLQIESILIYEALNRPRIYRWLENLVTRFDQRTRTLGIAQVQSSTPLSDVESVYRMGEYLADLRTNLQPDLTASDVWYQLLSEYNGGRYYDANVFEIHDLLADSQNSGALSE